MFPSLSYVINFSLSMVGSFPPHINSIIFITLLKCPLYTPLTPSANCPFLYCPFQQSFLKYLTIHYLVFLSPILLPYSNQASTTTTPQICFPKVINDLHISESNAQFSLLLTYQEHLIQLITFNFVEIQSFVEFVTTLVSSPTSSSPALGSSTSPTSPHSLLGSHLYI